MERNDCPINARSPKVKMGGEEFGEVNCGGTK